MSIYDIYRESTGATLLFTAEREQAYQYLKDYFEETGGLEDVVFSVDGHLIESPLAYFGIEGKEEESCLD
jgi:hypothetical protein